MPSVHKTIGYTRLPSFSEYFDTNMSEVELDINEIKEKIKEAKIPVNIQTEIFVLLDNSTYDMIEQRYTDYISSKYDSLVSSRSDSYFD